MKEILLSLVGKRVDNRHNWVQGREKRAAVVCPTGDQHQEEKEEHRKLLSGTLGGMPLKRKRVRSSYVVVGKRKQKTNHPQLSELPQTSSRTGPVYRPQLNLCCPSPHIYPVRVLRSHHGALSTLNTS
jgi:hypothetical protein